jgi:hypothetical protein
MSVQVINFSKRCATCQAPMAVIKKMSGMWWYECPEGHDQPKKPNRWDLPPTEQWIRDLIEANRGKNVGTEVVIWKGHRWSLHWPGNHCLNCGLDGPEGAEDALIGCPDCPAGCDRRYGTGCVPNPNQVIPPCEVRT